MRPIGEPPSPSQLNEDEQMALRNARTICVALIVGVAMFGGIIGGVSMNGGVPIPWPPTLTHVPRQVLMIAALSGVLLLAAIPAVVVLRKLMLARAVDPSTGRMDPSSFVTANIVPMAMLEGPALVALVSCLMGKSLWPGGVVALVAVVMMIAFVPRASQFGSARGRGAASKGDHVYGYREPEKWE